MTFALPLAGAHSAPSLLCCHTTEEVETQHAAMPYTDANAQQELIKCVTCSSDLQWDVDA